MYEISGKTPPFLWVVTEDEIFYVREGYQQALRLAASHKSEKLKKAIGKFEKEWLFRIGFDARLRQYKWKIACAMTCGEAMALWKAFRTYSSGETHFLQNLPPLKDETRVSVVETTTRFFSWAKAVRIISLPAMSSLEALKVWTETAIPQEEMPLTWSPPDTDEAFVNQVVEAWKKQQLSCQNGADAT